MAQTGIDRLRALTAQLNRYRYEYYSLNAPTVSDEAYDRLLTSWASWNGNWAFSWAIPPPKLWGGRRWTS